MNTKPVSLSSSMQRVRNALSELYTKYREVPWWNEDIYSPWHEVFRPEWEKLESELGKAKTRYAPPAGHGLAAMWLRVVGYAAARVEECAREHELGYDGVIGSDDFMFLASGTADYLSRKTLKVLPKVTHTMQRLASPEPFPDAIEALHSFAANSPPTKAKLEQWSSLAGEKILNVLNNMTMKPDQSLDEIVLFALGLNYKEVQYEYVFRALVHCWLNDTWRGFPSEYNNDCGNTAFTERWVVNTTSVSKQLELITNRINSLVIEPSQQNEESVDTGYWSRRIQVMVNSSEPIVVLDGRSFPVRPDQALMLDLLVQKEGDWISMSDEKHIRKPSETKINLPKELLGLIEAKSGKGYRLVRRNPSATTA